MILKRHSLQWHIEESIENEISMVKKIAGGVGTKMFRIGLLDDMSININGEKLNHLRFAHDIVVITNRIDGS